MALAVSRVCCSVSSGNRRFMVATAASTTQFQARRLRGYGTSTAYSLGVEEEFQLLDPATHELTPVVDDVIASVPEADRGQVKHELMQSVVETSTTVCANVEEAVA